MATYNGAKFVRQQIESILPQLGATDEVIIVDDASTDETVEIIHQLRDGRIHLVQNARNEGVVKAFERALQLATGDLIFLADQDDLWDATKVATLRREFDRDPKTTLLVSDATMIDADGNVLGRWSERRPFSSGLVTNLIRNRFVGCLMAFRRRLLDASLPFPPDIPMHDAWIGLMGHFCGRTRSVPQCLVSYRRHGATVTTGKHADFFTMLRWRVTLIRHLLVRANSGRRSVNLGR